MHRTSQKILPILWKLNYLSYRQKESITLFLRTNYSIGRKIKNV